LNIRGSTIIAARGSDDLIESFCGYLQVLWPAKVLRKFNKNTPEDQKLVVNTDLQTLKYIPTLLPIVQRKLQQTSFILQSSSLPSQFKDFIPN
jgi:hypothetical protein